MSEHHHSKRFDPAHLERLEAPDRQQQFPVDRIIELADIRPGMPVADIGAGTGYFSIPIAWLVAPAKVFAIDPSIEMLDYIRAKIARPGMPTNIQAVFGEANVTSLGDRSCDVVFACSMWHEIDDHAAALKEFARILRPGGSLVIIDWKPSATRPPGPPAEHRIERAEVESTVRKHSWKVAKSDDVNEFVYIVVCTS